MCRTWFTFLLTWSLSTSSYSILRTELRWIRPAKELRQRARYTYHGLQMNERDLENANTNTRNEDILYVNSTVFYLFSACCWHVSFADLYFELSEWLFRVKSRLSRIKRLNPQLHNINISCSYTSCNSDAVQFWRPFIRKKRTKQKCKACLLSQSTQISLNWKYW